MYLHEKLLPYIDEVRETINESGKIVDAHLHIEKKYKLGISESSFRNFCTRHKIKKPSETLKAKRIIANALEGKRTIEIAQQEMLTPQNVRLIKADYYAKHPRLTPQLRETRAIGINHEKYKDNGTAIAPNGFATYLKDQNGQSISPHDKQCNFIHRINGQNHWCQNPKTHFSPPYCDDCHKKAYRKTPSAIELAYKIENTKRWKA